MGDTMWESVQGEPGLTHRAHLKHSYSNDLCYRKLEWTVM
jgi:hypothetical protein